MIQSAEEFVRLRRSANSDLYQRAACDHAPEHVWLETIEKYPEMKRWVAHNKTVPHRILCVLADDGDPGVRAAVAMKRKAGPELLARLAQDTDVWVRQRVAFNAKTPLHILEKLAEDPEESVAAGARDRIRGLSGSAPYP